MDPSRILPGRALLHPEGRRWVHFEFYCEITAPFRLKTPNLAHLQYFMS